MYSLAQIPILIALNLRRMTNLTNLNMKVRRRCRLLKKRMPKRKSRVTLSKLLGFLVSYVVLTRLESFNSNNPTK